MRRLHGIFAFLVVPALGYLLGATIFNLCWDIAEPGDLADTEFVAVAKSCEQHGPLAWRGFGFYYKCATEVRSTSGGSTRMRTATGWLEPADIGTPFAVSIDRHGAMHPQERPYQGLGGLLAMVFGVFWIFVIAWTANPVLKGFTERMREKRLALEREQPVEEKVFVMGGPSPRFRARDKILLLLLAIGGFIQSVRAAFEGRTNGIVMAAVCAAVAALIILNGARRLLRSPAVSIKAGGIEAGDQELSWADIQQVRLSRSNVLIIEPQGIEIGPFGDAQATEIHDAMQKYGQSVYKREQLAS